MMTRDEKIAYDKGYEDGNINGYADAQAEIRDLIQRSGLTRLHLETIVNPLEDFVVRWDAALRAWVVTQDSREHVVRIS